MADVFIDILMKKCILDVLREKDKIKDAKEIWFSMTRQMFKNYPAATVYELVERALCEASDEQWFKHKYPKGSKNENWIYPKKKRSVIKINLKNSRTKKLINDNIKITDVAKSYGLKVKKEKSLCPFHEDKNPSLGFDDKRNIFHCFGCNAKGDIIEFKRRMKKWEKEMKQQKNS